MLCAHAYVHACVAPACQHVKTAVPHVDDLNKQAYVYVKFDDANVYRERVGSEKKQIYATCAYKSVDPFGRRRVRPNMCPFSRSLPVFLTFYTMV